MSRKRCSVCQVEVATKDGQIFLCPLCADYEAKFGRTRPKHLHPNVVRKCTQCGKTNLKLNSCTSTVDGQSILCFPCKGSDYDRLYEPRLSHKPTTIGEHMQDGEPVNNGEPINNGESVNAINTSVGSRKTSGSKCSLCRRRGILRRLGSRRQILCTRCFRHAWPVLKSDTCFCCGKKNLKYRMRTSDGQNPLCTTCHCLCKHDGAGGCRIPRKLSGAVRARSVGPDRRGAIKRQHPQRASKRISNLRSRKNQHTRPQSNSSASTSSRSSVDIESSSAGVQRNSRPVIVEVSDSEDESDEVHVINSPPSKMEILSSSRPRRHTDTAKQLRVAWSHLEDSFKELDEIMQTESRHSDQ